MGAAGRRWMIRTALALAICPAPRHALAAEDEFYKGKTVTLVVGYSAGGGYDQYARALARHLGSHIPGNPSVLVQNMPGAASLTAVRYLDANAPKDGTVITTFDPGLITESFASPEIFKVRFSDYQWVGTMLRDIRICYAWGATGIKTWDDMMKRKEFLIGTTAKGSNAYVNGAILRKIFNAPVRQIAGYPGSNEQRLALERGELEGNCGSWSAMPQDWVVQRQVQSAGALLAQASARHAARACPSSAISRPRGAEGSARRAQRLGRAGPALHRRQGGPAAAGERAAHRLRGRRSTDRGLPGRGAGAIAAARSGAGRGGGGDHRQDLCGLAGAGPQGQGCARIGIGPRPDATRSNVQEPCALAT